ncbi:hypothetical protein THIOM_000112 [Candidatus Thiomargarita nelsonii]|uniref:Uncharacterized protein n=1 Tax=Candidatus Thiomargarita nelsonii TaxID=1003181 RepID=A0A176S7S9_9GAMM|nr:hypothetical protein THIOM_000112 [Candidatus Thiomargarita nelsonii]
MKQDLINVNFLTDIISNSVGILVLFAVLNIVHEEKTVYKLEVPIEHQSSLAPAFFICKDDAIVFIDPETIFTNAIIQADRGLDNQIFSLAYMNLDGQIAEDRGLILYANDTSLWHDKDDSEIRQALDKLDTKKHFAFFFVYDEEGSSGFEIFRHTRQYLKKRHIKSGWQPVNENNPPHICFWSDVPACRYFPSYQALSK